MVALTLLTALVSALSLAAAATPAELAERAVNPACVSGDAVHIIVARASTELPGEGIIGQVATMVKAQLPGSTSEAISYPATLYPYLSSEAAGVSAMTSAVQSAPTSSATPCAARQASLGAAPPTHAPSARRRLPRPGPSEGSQSAASTPSTPLPSLKASSSASYQAPPRARSSRQSRWATLRSRPGSDVGTSRTRGLFPRSSSGVQCLQGFADRLRSYCDTGDQFCASGYSTAVHLSYVQKCGSQAASFVVSRARATA